VLDPTERARRTIHELNTRHAYDQQAEEEERAAQLALWHDDDQTAQDFRGAEPGGGGVLGQLYEAFLGEERPGVVAGLGDASVWNSVRSPGTSCSRRTRAATGGPTSGRMPGGSRGGEANSFDDPTAADQQRWRVPGVEHVDHATAAARDGRR